MRAGVKGVIVGNELECMLDDPHFSQFLLQDKDNFSGSIVENEIEKEVEEVEPTLKRCCSYSVDRSSNSNFCER